ncbi:MAG: FkbM family methyltransferase [Actinomycetota bacterium]|nr:FkbM family methyltransferase [Actinomycetota bacterium]
MSSVYGQNLVELAELLALAEVAEPLQMLDVGANIGDSTKQIMNSVPAQVLAIEADPYYLGYLRRNVGALPAVTIAAVLLTTASNSERQFVPSRRGGTTQFRESAGGAVPAKASRRSETSESGDSTGSLSVEELPRAYPKFARVRLIKSDTDGHDTELVPKLAAVYDATRPVLFFEYDPALTSNVTGGEASLVWAELAALGYDRVGFWRNDGVKLRECECKDAATTALELLAAAAYLDAVVVHSDDVSGRAALNSLFSESPRRTRP